ncbi:redoxin domain-containing protein [candidate division KSB1 bacterium]|nr:redoxin domain-containing protein [candidate division KSB1 bacterium]
MVGAVGSLLVIVAAAFSFYIVTYIQGVNAAPLEYVGQKSPPLTFRYVSDDSQGQLEQFEGNVILLDYWATWCIPCLKEMPDLDKLTNKYQGKGLVLICVSDKSKEQLQVYADTTAFNMIRAYLPKEGIDQRRF